MSRCVHPIVCPPRFVVHDRFIRRSVPVIHPVVRINRLNIVHVPRNIVRPFTRNIVVDRGFAGPGFHGFRRQGLFGPGIY